MSAGGVAPSHVDSSECHGTGTVLGDPIEVGSLIQVLLTRMRPSPLILGTSKSNIAHLETTAGAAGIIKCHILLE